MFASEERAKREIDRWIGAVQICSGEETAEHKRAELLVNLHYSPVAPSYE